jgi:hypothetical protein
VALPPLNFIAEHAGEAAPTFREAVLLPLFAEIMAGSKLPFPELLARWFARPDVAGEHAARFLGLLRPEALWGWATTRSSWRSSSS